ncbi:DUF2283 domain-containing protein [Rhodohalobacter sp.]|uniref:DUF2283 domain-containing protein n=1 Tax=Rhodohalobacter sp. TaxID=1974210 RepID=UPI002ACEE687|nr:DUF2283 domain-containing protein [Rhodohalobacter sp.]MDZ7756748.1 DUF2283 domain-containing protein [Rhodohalobacter sp.]
MIENAINHPDRIIEETECKRIYHKFLVEDQSENLLRVFVNACKKPALVIAPLIKHRKSINMNIKFDKEADAIYLKLSDAEVAESDEEKPGIIIDNLIRMVILLG